MLSSLAKFRRIFSKKSRQFSGNRDAAANFRSVIVRKPEEFARACELELQSEEDEEMPQNRGAAKRRKAAGEHNGNMVTTADTRYQSKREERLEREGIVLWKRPLTTLTYFALELGVIARDAGKKLWRRKLIVFFLLILIAVVAGVCNLNGPHQQYLNVFRSKFFWCVYWIGLGVLSSVGLGTGLHTFLLYLGPHIASVTLAAYECGTLNFPQPPYPDEIICPEDENGSTSVSPFISLWSIMSKVRLEAFMWVPLMFAIGTIASYELLQGAGTALGELPPYFMARAARLSGIDVDDEELEELLSRREDDPQTRMSRAKLAIQRLVEKVGFFGILACASIPNPLFDLAGITCGHFLVPFWTFFGATLIGKAVIKMHIQKLFVIIAFNEVLVERAVNVSERVPYVGKYINAPFREFLEKQKAKLHRRAGTRSPQESSWLSSIFEKVVIAMVAYFVLSIINSLAQKYHKRLYKVKRDSVSGFKRAKD